MTKLKPGNGVRRETAADPWLRRVVRTINPGAITLTLECGHTAISCFEGNAYPHGVHCGECELQAYRMEERRRKREERRKAGGK
jgi:hypothetical protein